MEAALRVEPQRAKASDHAFAPGTSADTVLRRHLPLVRDVAHQVACRKPPHVEVDELMSWGMEGLLDAYRRFRPDKHASFRTYARFRVRGVIMDNLRERDLLSRTARRKAVLLERTRAKLEATLGRAPGEAEIAATLRIDLGKLRSMTRETEFGTVSVEDLRTTDDRVYEVDRHMPDHAADPLRAILGRERARLVNAAIGRLPEKEHAAVTLYYKSDRTMREVADALGLSESRVSQLHSQALGRLRALLADDLLSAD
ncbi:MAG: FliA/WhiG family RNA polymerase sigma factor [Deltaproteobacteria bacterium]|nr:FliA/WhiG family RNA polymerase sigma factor [Deltaproteobacteria bacterium]